MVKSCATEMQLIVGEFKSTPCRLQLGGVKLLDNIVKRVEDGIYDRWPFEI